MAKINHDQLFKELLTTFFVEFIDLFFPSILEYLDTDSIQFVDKEVFTDIVRGEKNILDLVALAQFQSQDYSFLVHLENQASNAPEFNRRMFRYFCSLFLVLVRVPLRLSSARGRTANTTALSIPSLFSLIILPKDKIEMILWLTFPIDKF